MCPTQGGNELRDVITDATPFDVTLDLIDLRHVWEPVDPLRCHCLSK